MATRPKGPKLPKYDERRGWTGGDTRALYAWTDLHTGLVYIKPVGQTRGVGPMMSVRLATRAEAEAAEWGVGWIVADGVTTKRLA